MIQRTERKLYGSVICLSVTQNFKHLKGVKLHVVRQAFPKRKKILKLFKE